MFCLILSTSLFQPYLSYGQSKTANILFSIALTKKFSKDGIYSNSLMTGDVVTNLQKHMSEDAKKARGMVKEDGTPISLPKGFKTIEQGAATTIYATVAPELENRGGLFLGDCKIAPVMSKEEIVAAVANGDIISGVLAYALDENAAERLWEITEQTLKSVEASKS